MTLFEAVAVLFETTPTVPGVLCVQALIGEGWRTIPLEWNQAVRLANIAQGEVRIVGSDGSVRAIYTCALPGQC